MTRLASTALPLPLMQRNCGPILALPEALTANTDPTATTVGMEVVQAACEALSGFEVGGDSLQPDDALVQRLDRAILECGVAAADLPGELKTAKNRIYDATFGVARTRDAGLGLAHGIGMATKSLLNQLGRANRLMPSARLDLVGGLAGATTSLAPTVDFNPRFLTNPAMAELESYDPLERWVEGHWFFFTCCQLAIVFHHKANAAIAAGDQLGEREALNAASVVYRAIGHGFSLAGDITPAEYEPIVAKMIAVDNGFSGLWFADHQLVKQLTHKVTKACPMAEGGARARYVAETNFMFHAHSFVCEDVSGGERASLMGQGQNDEEPGPTKLRRFAGAALKLAGANIDRKR